MLHFETWLWNYVHGVDSIMKNENKRTFQGGHNNIKIVVCKYREFEWNTGNMGLPRWPLVVKNLPANKGDVRDKGLTPRSGRSPGGEHGNPLQYSCLENQRSLAGYTPWGRTELDTTELTWHTDTQEIARWTTECDNPMVPSSQQRPVLLLKL